MNRDKLFNKFLGMDCEKVCGEFLGWVLMSLATAAVIWGGGYAFGIHYTYGVIFTIFWNILIYGFLALILFQLVLIATKLKAWEAEYLEQLKHGKRKIPAFDSACDNVKTHLVPKWILRTTAEDLYINFRKKKHLM